MLQDDEINSFSDGNLLFAAFVQIILLSYICTFWTVKKTTTNLATARNCPTQVIAKMWSVTINKWSFHYIRFDNTDLICLHTNVHSFILVLHCFLLFCFPDHESQPAVTDNEDNLLGNVSSCFNSLDIKQDFRVENLQEQENKQSRKRQNNTTDKEKEVIISGEYVTGIYVPILFVKSILSL